MYSIEDNWDVNNRACHYGDGVFTTMRVASGDIDLLKYHQLRLENDSGVIGLPAPSQNVWDHASMLAEQVKNGIVKIVLSAGSGGRGYHRLAKLAPTAHFFVSAVPASYEHLRNTGMRVVTSNIQLSSQPALAGIKHLNRLEQVLIKNGLIGTHYDDALVFDFQNNLIEASSANIFVLVKNKGWMTPQLTHCGVNGVQRARLIDYFKQAGIPLQITNVSRQDVQSARAVMLTNAIMECMPILEWDDEGRCFDFDVHPVLQLSKVINGEEA
ncbi:aminodeoxychorismate lyase [Alteromonas sp. 5E99-2]|uniref:aminodeoxychorismate lyase n=1 Tax=Alteromonas sp. 5E99-2 TaxID=2817683 RepID=UPI001A984059|nr:aminodeoxychorismate lyase [Alteromonas sp. 5E99-2]